MEALLRIKAVLSGLINVVFEAVVLRELFDNIFDITTSL